MHRHARTAWLLVAMVALAGCTVIVGDELGRRRDAGGVDGGGTDAGPVDAGSDDAGSDDAGSDDAGPDDAGESDACVASAEICDGFDTDCDSTVDEDVTCALPNATSSCTAGACAITSCNSGHLDCSPLDPGCEADAQSHRTCGACDVDCSAEQECLTGPARCASRPIGWFKPIRNTTNHPLRMLGLDADAAGVVYAGVSAGPFQIDAITAATPAPYVVGLSSTGTVSWLTNIQQDGGETLVDVAAVPTGGVLVGAYASPSVNSEIFLWQRHPAEALVSVGPFATDAALVGLVAANGAPVFLRAIVAPSTASSLALHDVAVRGTRGVIVGTHSGAPWMMGATAFEGPVWLARTSLPGGATFVVNRYGSQPLTSIGVALRDSDTVIAGVFDTEYTLDGRTFTSDGFATVMWRVDNTGAVRWAIQLPLTGSAGEETPPYPAFDAAGNVYVRGDCQSATCTVATGANVPTGRYLASFAGDGTFRWARPIGGRNFGSFDANVDELLLADEVALGDDLGGGPFSTTGGSTDVALAVYDTRGRYLRGTRFGGALYDSAGGVAANSIDQTFLSGTFRGLVNVGGSSFTASAAMGDGFIMRIDPAP